MKFDEAREALDVDLRGALLHARRDLAQAQRETQVVQRAMVEDKERMRRDAAAAPEADGEAREANRAFVLRARDRAAAERDVPPRRVERHNHEVRGQRAHTRAQDEDIRALIDEMRAEMREIRSLMQEMRAHAGAAPAAGDRLHYVDERRVETTTEAIDAVKDAHRAGRPVRLRWAREGAESTEPAPAQPIRLRWQRAAEAPKTQAVEEVVEVSTSPVSGSPVSGDR